MSTELAASVAERMRKDWDDRAGEDAHYYVAFGRRNQTGDEFFATAQEQVQGLVTELRRLEPAPARTRRALEIGCGPGRLMRPMSEHFGEIHGVDVSEKMVTLARANLAGVRHAHPHWAPDSTLAAFASASFHLVYSYAVFQHIPSREVVFGYLAEATRVLKPGGLIRCQLNGLPATAAQYDTWSGVRVAAKEVRDFARDAGLRLLALEGADTQYMWATLRKPDSAVGNPGHALRIRRVTSAHSSEPAVPVRGRFAAVALWVDGLGDEGLNEITVRVGGAPAVTTYLGPAEPDGLRQVNALLPEGVRSGIAPIRIETSGRAAESLCRLIPPAPPVPRLMSLTDGIDLLSGRTIATGTCKATVEEVNPRAVAITVNGVAVESVDTFRTDPRIPSDEINFDLPPPVAAGPAVVELRLGRRLLGRVEVIVAPRAGATAGEEKT